MAKDNELGAAHVRIGADLAPLRAALPNAQRMVNTTMQRIANTTAQFGTNLGRSMGKIAGLAGFVGLGGTLALATREAVKQLDAQKGLAAAVGTTFGQYRRVSGAVETYTKALQKLYPASRAAVTDVAAYLIREGKFQGRALEDAIMSAFGLSTHAGTPMQGAQALTGMKFGQPGAELRYGERYGGGLASGKYLDQLLAKGREGLGIQQRIADMPVEQGRRVLTRALDRLADAVRSGIERLGVLDRLFTKDPQGAIGISPAQTLFQQGVDDKVHPVLGRVRRELSWYQEGAVPRGQASIARGRRDKAHYDSIVQIRPDSFGGGGRSLPPADPNRPWLRAFDWALGTGIDASESGMGAARNALQRLDDATTPGTDTMADMLENISGGHSDSRTHSTGLGPEERAALGGAVPGVNTLQTSLDENTKATKDLTHAVETVGGLQ